MSAEHDGYGVSAQTFQALIRERKLEKNRIAEKKRVEAVKSIRERKSKSGVDPLERFPKEVWEMILDELDEPKGLCNVYQIHGVFQDLLENRKIRDILFPQVLDLCIQADPDLYDYPLALDMNMRTLSKSMRKGVDRWYEDNLHRHLQIGKYSSIPPGMQTIEPDESKDVEQLLGYFLSSNPEKPKPIRFIQRSLHVTWPTCCLSNAAQDEHNQRFPEECARERNNIRTLLEFIGDQIWHFDLWFEGFTVSQIYDTLVELVMLMPNLKWLELDVNLNEKKGYTIAPQTTNHPFPTLVNLERLDVTFGSGPIEVLELYEAIFSANRHLKRLHIHGKEDEPIKRLHTAHLDSLETFYIGEEPISVNCFKFSTIQPLLSLKWQLKQIQLSLGHEQVSVTDIFQFLENFQTLEQVILNIIKVRVAGDLKFLNLPNLTEFKLKFDPSIDFRSSSTVQFFFSLQFLLFCKKLKKLEWTNMNEMMEEHKLVRLLIDRECDERMISFRAGHMNLKHSNIWDVFPFLELIHVSLIKPYTMDDSHGAYDMVFERIERDLPGDKYAGYYSW